MANESIDYGTNSAKSILPIKDSVPCNALAGIRVVELTEYVAAPMCGRMLADYGAEVIKIEKVTGDPWRSFGKATNCGATDEENPLFDIYNSRKKSIVLNLKDPEDLESLYKLLETADIFLTNTRLKGLEKMGLDPETLQKRYPSLIYALLTGYGIDGEEKDEPGFDSVSFWGRSGMLRDLPYLDSRYPIAMPTGVGDTISGIVLLTGILAALVKRAHTGAGDFVTASLLGSSIWSAGNMVIQCQPTYAEVFPRKREDSNPEICTYKCADGEWIQIGIMNYGLHMPKLLEVLGLAELIHDPRFETQAEAEKHWKEMYHLFEKQFLTKPCQEWVDLIKPIDMVCCKLPHFGDIAGDQQAWANGNLETFHFRNDNTCVMPCPPVRFGSTGTIKSSVAPQLGEHTREVLDAL